MVHAARTEPDPGQRQKIVLLLGYVCWPLQRRAADLAPSTPLGKSRAPTLKDIQDKIFETMANTSCQKDLITPQVRNDVAVFNPGGVDDRPSSSLDPTSARSNACTPHGNVWLFAV